MHRKIVVKGVSGGLLVPTEVREVFAVVNSNCRRDALQVTSPARVTSGSCMKSRPCMLGHCAALNTVGNGAKDSEGVGA